MLMDEFDHMLLQDLDHQKVFDIRSAKSKEFYKLLLSIKAKLTNISNRLLTDLMLKIRSLKFISCHIAFR